MLFQVGSLQMVDVVRVRWYGLGTDNRNWVFYPYFTVSCLLKENNVTVT